MWRITRYTANPGLTLAILLTVVALTATAAQARPKKRLAIGGGLITSRVSGDTDGSRYYFRDPNFGPFILAGDLEPGSGGLLTFQVTFIDYLGLDVLLMQTNHDATHTALPGYTMSAHILSLMTMARGNLPLGERFELYGRAGISYDYLTYDDNTVTVTSVELKSSTFEGLGLGLGFGAAMFLGPVGIDAGLLYQRVSFDYLSADTVDGALDDTLDVNIVSAMLTATYHFVDR